MKQFLRRLPILGRWLKVDNLMTKITSIFNRIISLKCNRTGNHRITLSISAASTLHFSRSFWTGLRQFWNNWELSDSNRALNKERTHIYAVTCLLLLAWQNWIILNVNITFSRQSPVLPHFQPKFGAFVRIFI
jgi:hypothetical protein